MKFGYTGFFVVAKIQCFKTVLIFFKLTVDLIG